MLLEICKLFGQLRRYGNTTMKPSFIILFAYCSCIQSWCRKHVISSLPQFNIFVSVFMYGLSQQISVNNPKTPVDPQWLHRFDRKDLELTCTCRKACSIQQKFAWKVAKKNIFTRLYNLTHWKYYTSVALFTEICPNFWRSINLQRLFLKENVTKIDIN